MIWQRKARYLSQKLLIFNKKCLIKQNILPKSLINVLVYEMV